MNQHMLQSSSTRGGVSGRPPPDDESPLSLTSHEEDDTVSSSSAEEQDNDSSMVGAATTAAAGMRAAAQPTDHSGSDNDEEDMDPNELRRVPVPNPRMATAPLSHNNAIKQHSLSQQRHQHSDESYDAENRAAVAVTSSVSTSIRSRTAAKIETAPTDAANAQSAARLTGTS